MRFLFAVALCMAILLQLSGCGEEQGEKIERAEKIADEAKEEEEALTEEKEEEGGALSPSDRVALALQVRDKEVTLTGKEKARVETNKGTFVFEFYTDDAPNTVKNFIRLSQAGFYDGLTFHRYVENFVIQGGDPQGTGMGNSGYNIDAEFNKRKHVVGTVAMARGRDPNSASCQWYVTLTPQPSLDEKYTVFGQVVEGMAVVKLLRVGDTMDKITIE